MDKFKNNTQQHQEPFASITVDCVILGYHNKNLDILLIKRNSEPEEGRWALPGGFIERDETSDQSAERILQKLTGVSNTYLEQFYTFTDPKRHTIARVITIAYFALVNPLLFELNPSWYAKETKWFDINNLPQLPFDHNEIIKKAIQTLKRDVKLKPIGFELLPKKFTLSELQNLYEVVSDKKLDKRNFRKKIKDMEILAELKELKNGCRHRPARLYSFDIKQYKKFLTNNSSHFEF